MASAFLLSSLCPTAFVGPLPRRSFLGARLSLPPTPPPPPFPVQPYVSHNPPYERESSFVGMHIRVPLAPAFLVASDAGLCPCPPPPPSLLYGLHRLGPVSGLGGPWGPRATGAGTGQATVVATHGAELEIL